MYEKLHWPPIKQRIDYKFALTTYKALVTNQPTYLRSMLTIDKPARALRSGSKVVMLNIPYCKTVTVARAFSNNAPRIWNGLPKVVRDCFSESTPPTSTEMF